MKEAMHTLYMLQHTAIEIYMTDGQSALLSFPSNKVREWCVCVCVGGWWLGYPLLYLRPAATW